MAPFKEYIKVLQQFNLIDVKDWWKRKDAEKWFKDLLENESVIDFLANDPKLSKSERKRVAKEYFHNCIARFDPSKIKPFPESKCECESHSWETFMHYWPITSKIAGDDGLKDFDAGSYSYIVCDTGTNAVYILPCWLFFDDFESSNHPHVVKNHGSTKGFIGILHNRTSSVNICPNIFDIRFDSPNNERVHLGEYLRNKDHEMDDAHLHNLLAMGCSELLLNIVKLPLYSFDKRMITTMDELKKILLMYIYVYWQNIRVKNKTRTCTVCQKTLKKIRCCAECKLIRYCSRECQKKNRNVHRSLCESMKFARQRISEVKSILGKGEI